MYKNIFKTLENRFKEYESLERYLDSHIEELQTENQRLIEQIKILELELNAAYSLLNKGMNE